jgi:hypothetical protein
MKFKAGDKVRVKDWFDMADEFGVNEYGDILCEFFFTESMLHLCGKVFTVDRFREVIKGAYVFKEQDINRFYICDDMLVGVSLIEWQ